CRDRLDRAARVRARDPPPGDGDPRAAHVPGATSLTRGLGLLLGFHKGSEARCRRVVTGLGSGHDRRPAMRALTFSRFGDPSVLEVREVPDPIGAPGIAVVRTRAIGLNFADAYRRQGRYHLVGSAPWIAGYEASGEIAVADGPWASGDRVAFADAPHANAELVAVPVDHLIPLPDDITHDIAAAV